MNALIPGSFDPITLGHVNVIERASKMFDKVFVVIMNNDSSKYDKTLRSKTYLLTPDERIETVRRSVAHIKNAEVIYYDGMLIDACDTLNAYAVIRGVRNSRDFEYELIHARWNREHNDKIEVFFIPAEPSLTSVSSSMVREIIQAGENFDKLEGVLHPEAIAYFKDRGH